MAEKTVDAYIASLLDWQAELVSQVRQIVLDVAPEAKESIKWSQPVFESNGPFAYVRAFKTAVNFGFMRGADLDDPGGLLQGSGDKMRHIKISDPKNIDVAVFSGFVRQAVALNRAEGDPPRKG